MKDVLSVFGENSSVILLSVMTLFITITAVLLSYVTSIKNRREERYIQQLMYLKEIQKAKNDKKDLLSNSTVVKDSKLGYPEPEKQKNVVKEEHEVKSDEKTLDIYEQQATTHSNLQFYAGLTMSIVGFILLIGIIIFSIGSDNTINSAISVIGSLIFEGISLMFLKESQKLRIRVKEYHDNLMENSNRNKSIALAGKIQDEKLRSLVQAQLAFNLMEIDPGKLNISNISEKNHSPSKKVPN
ncbi:MULTISPECIES: hypothetical protein [Bacillus]|uniref:hypothetical protein n=1 Tax=Bacillus TaxID=1386 RepID=UPI0013640336|nr:MULTISPECIES: hypothetical protein [Bacillus]MBT9286566.1 hypothetical protein [Bacillus velezensis]MCX2820928.1 hypothetical protein [Bacillus sp. H1F1]QHJ02883.1 hypothetical protein GNE05_06430 [Bacillus sp. AM1(2019)]QOE05291.1 hypothetical protein BAMOH1_06025 [Bacillus amyloliquefaciens]QZY33946.1 hypothetical protein BAJP3144_06055 [Bacillus amyloliquefaciens]